jgi:hypothetical protein
MTTTVELSPINIQLNQATGTPTATFKFRPTRARVSITCRFIVKHKLLFVSKPRFNVNVTNGTLTFNIPRHTEAIEIAVVYPLKNIRFVDYYPKYCEAHFKSQSPQLRMMVRWCNEVAIDTSGLDHTRVQPGEDRTFGHQLGPHRSSRAMAIIHLAMMEAYNSIKQGEYTRYITSPVYDSSARTPAAVAQAAHDTLVALFPSHATRLAAILAEQLGQLPNDTRRALGVAAGSAAAVAVLADRASDGSAHAEVTIAEYNDLYGANLGSGNGIWGSDPVTGNQIALGARWGTLVNTFVVPSATTFRCPTPPALNSVEYQMAFDEVKSMGGDVTNTPTVRSDDDTVSGIFWAYDGTPSLCAPPRLYNQVATTVIKERDITGPELLRLLTVLNVAMADAGIISWESKYHYNIWRPVTGIRQDDGNPATVTDPSWTPLGAPNSNVISPTNFTPPFPSYPSGHATFGGTLFELLRLYLGTDNVPFTFISDEYNGVTTDNEGNPRPLVPRTYNKLSDAEEENGQSRIYLGIHWSFDKTEGIHQGNQIAQFVYSNLYTPLA